MKTLKDAEPLVKACHDVAFLAENLRIIYGHATDSALILVIQQLIEQTARIEQTLQFLKLEKI
jgi:hypothetical protein